MLDHQNRETLTAQLVNKIRNDIRCGVLVPGQKLPGERALAKEFSICRVTVISALKRLENENLIEKIPQRGSFVKDHTLPAKIALLCPEEYLGKSKDMEMTFSFFEFHRGVLAEAMKQGVPLGIECIPTRECENDPARFVSQLQKYDSLIFPTRSLQQLREKFYGKKRLIVNSGPIFSEEDFANCIYLTYDQHKGFAELIKKAQALGWKNFSLVMMEDLPWFRERCRRFCKEAEKLKASVNIIDCFEDTPACELEKCRGTFVFCNHTIFFGRFYSKCEEAGLIPGKDFSLAGLCSGFTLGNLEPAPGFLKIPLFELGAEAVRWALGLPETRTTLEAVITEGKTIKSMIKEKENVDQRTKITF